MKRIFLARVSDFSGKGLLSVLGPTGTGKTQSVLDLILSRWPQNLKTPLLVSLDSVAVYQGLDIGSAKPRNQDYLPFDWIGIDITSPDKRMSAAEFAHHVAPSIEKAKNNNRPIIMVGGSHFYEKFILSSSRKGAASDPDFLQTLSAQTNLELWRRLKEHDARWSQKVHPNDRYRLERFSDLSFRQGLSFDDLHGSNSEEALSDEVQTVLLGTDLSAEKLAPVLERRIENMLETGWLEEVQNLLSAGLSPDAPGLQSVGYRDVVAYLTISKDAEELKKNVLISHLQLAKKQRTWLRSLQTPRNN